MTTPARKAALTKKAAPKKVPVKKAAPKKAPAAPKPPDKPSIVISYDLIEDAAEYLFWAPGTPEREWVLDKTFWQRVFRRPAMIIQIPAGPSIPLFRITVDDDRMYEYGNFRTSHIPRRAEVPRS